MSPEKRSAIKTRTRRAIRAGAVAAAVVVVALIGLMLIPPPSDGDRIPVAIAVPLVLGGAFWAFVIVFLVGYLRNRTK